MQKNIFRKSLSVLVVLFFSALAAHAELGGDSTSVEKDRQHFGGTKTLRKTLKYSVYDLKSDRHMVHEFLDQKGQVFAVSWDGQLPPHLPTLFGPHHVEFLLKRISTPRVHGRRNFQTITTSTMQFIQVAHMGHWRGTAYLLNHVPPGLKIEELE